MRKVVAGLIISLDGVVESPNVWAWPHYMNDEMLREINIGIMQADTVLLGKHTYLGFTQLWSHRESDTPMADFLNNSPKYVVSSTLDMLEWQPATLIKGNLTEEITKRKQQSGKNIQIPESPTLVRSLLCDGLIDELTLDICPIVVASGMRLFDRITNQIKLKLIDTNTLSNGVIEVTYQSLHSNDQTTAQPLHFPDATTYK
ncbi:MAG: hypothetical protein GFH27_549303n116 [Chloroflexi bacterium AL-W]|nr:hypothetical protein [Chloroflexi bacterium AL-N1]NOK68001.1 hypothetical protein [Chloroflexi bacterium AL-N10]NOK73341.1 hypothetical protein [Chloroflexi bacterium AL-N5]NOK83255.1 hypothetical protein [Chloroflexi bacterium AL-W]NOK87672.1 hypothetical protein [Chloroflexi bacterium AL-N15]